MIEFFFFFFHNMSKIGEIMVNLNKNIYPITRMIDLLSHCM